MKKDIVALFWKKYYKSDLLGREKLLKSIQLGKRMEEAMRIKDKKLREHLILTSFRSYFDDLINVIEEVKR